MAALTRKNLFGYLIEKYELTTCPDCGKHPIFSIDKNKIDIIGCCHLEFLEKTQKDFCTEFLDTEIQLPDSGWYKITKKA